MSAPQGRVQKNSRARPRSKANPNTTTDSSDPLADSDIRVTYTHIYFVRGILSNWSASSEPFSGGRALQLCLLQLDELSIPHPAEDATSTRLIKSFGFGRGEQWMMAMKAWLFERLDIELGEETGVPDPDFDALCKEMLSTAPPTSSTPQRKQLWNSSLCSILRTNSPMMQKILGRKVPNFDEGLWDKISGAIVLAGCIARAEVDKNLERLYIAAGERVFVEGSKKDRVWGVGLDWRCKEILDEKCWRGGNRLGRAHCEAAAVVRDRAGKTGIKD
ncbi:NADAR family protein [Aspergillus stella-maris]|uniref:NADAR family protein n=1 Tax=Aspergillus stella-maris TaxID=1810926 RepID=UPI003CCCC09D